MSHVIPDIPDIVPLFKDHNPFSCLTTAEGLENERGPTCEHPSDLIQFSRTRGVYIV